MPNVILIQNVYPDDSALYNVINYAIGSKMPLKGQPRRSAIMRGGYGVSSDPEQAYIEMRLIKESFYKQDADGNCP